MKGPRRAPGSARAERLAHACTGQFPAGFASPAFAGGRFAYVYTAQRPEGGTERRLALRPLHGGAARTQPLPAGTLTAVMDGGALFTLTQVDASQEYALSTS